MRRTRGSQKVVETPNILEVREKERIMRILVQRSAELYEKNHKSTKRPKRKTRKKAK